VLIVAMILLVTLTLLGVTAMNTSTVQAKISANEQIGMRDFHNAESGLSAAFAAYASDPETIEASFPVTGTSLGAQWTLQNWPSGKLFDKIALARATGDTFSTTTHTYLRRVKIPAIVDGTISIYDAGQIDLFGNVHIDGRDHEPPSDFNCNGASCAPTLASSGEPDISAIYAQSGTDYVTEHGSTSKDGASPLIKTGGGILNDEIMLEFVTLLMSYATSHNGSDWGTRINPVIHHINTPMMINANTDGAGILLITADGVSINGNFHFEGLIVVASDTGVTFTLGGGADVCGAISVVGPNVDVAVGGTGTPNIVYCSSALENANRSSTVKRMAWAQER
jgi:hypothetical protein